jgi:hypothetical protein
MFGMKRELFIHFSFWFAFFVFIAVFKQYFALVYWQFWLGGLLGVILPDIDHIIYVYFIKPTDLTSQRVNYLVNKKELLRSVELLYETRNERKGLIFHTIFFQLIFFILTFWMLSSSGSYFGRGLVLSFILHLSVDQLIDLTELKNLENWFTYLPFKLDFNQCKKYWIASTAVIVLLGVLM